MTSIRDGKEIICENLINSCILAEEFRAIRKILENR
jgi:hypothetical protein